MYAVSCYSASSFSQVSRAVEEFEVKEQSIAYLTQICPNVQVQNMAVTAFHPQSKVTWDCTQMMSA